MLDRSITTTESDRLAEARERITEIGEILAAGLVRLRTRLSSPTSTAGAEGSLAYVGHQSGHANLETEKA